MQESEPQAWERKEGEGGLAYDAFTVYYQLSPRERSIDKAYQKIAPADRQERAKNAPRHWHRWSSDYRWVARAQAYDDYRAEQDRREFEAERKRDKVDRLRILRAYRSQLTQALARLNPEVAEWKDVTAGLKMVMEQIRSEYDEQPSQKIELSGKGGKEVVFKVIYGDDGSTDSPTQTT